METRTRKQLLDWAARQKHLSLSDVQARAMDTAYPQWRHSLDDSWQLQFEDCKVFFKANRRFPSSSAADALEKRLGIWLATQRKRANTLRGERRELLDGHLPGWEEKLRKSWELRLEEACAVTADLGRIPVYTDDDPAARSAYTWLTNIKRLPATDPRVLALNKRIPGWNVSYEDIWNQKLSATVAFYNTRGELPNKKSKDPAEKSLGVWLSNCKRNLESLPAERLQLLDAELPGWRKTRNDVWNDNVELVCAFIAEHGRFPRAKAKNAEEVVIGQWLQNQRSIADSQEESRLKVLDEKIPGWRQKVRADTWASMLDECVEFVRTSGRLPIVGGKEPKENWVGTWLSNQRAVKNTMPEDRREALTSRVPGWDITREDIWQAKLQMCVDFVRVNGRMPSSGKRAPEDEQELGRWLIAQRKTAAKLQRDGILDANLPGWR